MNAPERTPAEHLATPVQFLKGVGPQWTEKLHRLGLHTARDILFFFPRDYENVADRRQIAQLEEGTTQSVHGVVDDIELRNTGTGRSVLGVLIHAQDGYLRGLWFNQPFMRDRFSIGQQVIFTGRPKREGLSWTMAHPRVATLDTEQAEPHDPFLPIYPLTEGLPQWKLRRIVRHTVQSYAAFLDEVFPETYLRQHDLCPIQRAVEAIHFPPDSDGLLAARRRFVYQELLILQLALAVKRQQQTQIQAPPLPSTTKIDARIRRLFPFELTAGQREAIAQISADMGRPAPMNRLLQGDVGSGKTIVAVYAILLAVAHQHQAALMAPTEVLARQHGQTLARLLAHSQVRMATLTGAMPASQRTDLLAQVAAGQLDVVIGTHAILQDDVQFPRLGLVIIDEQHKFGVRQRATLKGAGPAPHYLVMTATPIPRTVTMTLFGDLDVSILRDSPPGRQKVHTYLSDESQRDQWWDFFRTKLREGRQGFVVAPLVDDSEQLQAASLAETYETLANGPLEAFRLGLIHGRMSPEEKDAVMADFRQGRHQVLVATSVVEVGVDVPNATLMTIESGERFGLAQLHQLRGRVSRGRHPGFCCVFAAPQTDQSRQRLEAFAATTDGFQLAEVDFAMRGPGELFGTRQHGLPPLRIADLTRDAQILEAARLDAQQMVATDPGLGHPEHERLRRMLLIRYGTALDLADVG